MAEIPVRYDINRYYDRWLQFKRMTHPKNIFVSKAELQKAIETIEKYQTNPRSWPVDAVWAAQEKTDALLHPITRQPIYKAFCWAAFMPVNVPILIGLLFTAPTRFNIISSQAVNQSYNSLVNYTYLNPNEPVSRTTFLTAFLGSVVTSIGVALKTRSLYEKYEHRMKEPLKTCMRVSTPFIAVACANIFNLLITRFSESRTGLPLMDQNFKPVYYDSKLKQCVISEQKEEHMENYFCKKAGKKSVMIGAATRALIPLPVCYLPPLAKELLVKMRLWPKGSTGGRILECFLASICLMYALPSAIAIFPPTVEINTADLGPEFKKINASGISTLYFQRSI